MLTSDERRFRDDVAALLGRQEVRAECAALAAAPEEDGHPRLTYRLLGAEGMLAPDWPRQYGGLDGPVTYQAILQEELARHDIPDTVFVNAVKNAGALLMLAADAGQKARHLPSLAAGTATMVLLYSEPEAGSDLASLRTRAERVAGGWRITGVKRPSVKTRSADHGIVAARTAETGRAEAGITLFVVGMRDDGVRVTPLETFNAEPFYEVAFDGVFVEDRDVLGPVGGGWFMLSAGLAIERTGVDYNAKARRWLDIAGERIRTAAPGRAELADRLADLRTQAAAGRLLAWGLLERQVEGELSAEEAAMSKWFNAELGAKAARLCLEADGTCALLERGEPGAARDGVVAGMLREAPGLRLSAGTSEVMLHIVASGLGLGGTS
ncbi:acyl-CoA dehydrogenase family protein [Nonomuraea candida]|uniref:acyl-CoA dehydrogenase family protein n=1 Tax=Nonomuraea candida TaxID=359159 RepID=UPI000694AF3B|nr:acyl-CoA dehydrogenase family protein [Nonomuraea candida]